MTLTEAHWSDWEVFLSPGSPRLLYWARCAAGNMSSVSVPPPRRLQKPLLVPHRHMFGPGPSNVPPRILEAGANPVIGHMHPEIFEVNILLLKGLQQV